MGKGSCLGFQLPKGGYITEANRIHLVLSDIQNRTLHPYLAAINGILISVMLGRGRRFIHVREKHLRTKKTLQFDSHESNICVPTVEGPGMLHY
jgi:hypothetical protein